MEPQNDREFRMFVWGLKIEMSAKLVLLVLRDFSFGRDSTFVSQEKVAAACGCSLRTVQRMLARLQAYGLLQSVQHGRLRQCYFTLPAEFMQQIELQGEEADNLSPVQGQTCAKLSACDNLSPVFKNKHKNQNPTPLPPDPQPGAVPQPEADSQPDRAKGRGGGGVPAGAFSSLESINLDFQRLAAVYPCREDLREAFEVYRRMYAELPSVAVLTRIVEYEKEHNGRWRREGGRYVTYLKNWLRFRQFQSAQMFMATLEGLDSAPASGIAAGCVTGQAAPTAPDAPDAPAGIAVPVDSVEAALALLPDEAQCPLSALQEENFASCAGLWRDAAAPSASVRAAEKLWSRPVWRWLAAQGLEPGLAEAAEGRQGCVSFYGWLWAWANKKYLGQADRLAA